MIVAILRGLLGIAFLLGVCWLCSEKRKSISWPLVAKALGLQVVLALLILKAPYFSQGFDFVARAFAKISEISLAGSEMIFGGAIVDNNGPVGFVFAARVLPTIIFFSAVSSLLYHYGILQKVVKFLATVMRRLLRISGAESLSAAGNIFLGQTEAPLLVKPFLNTMTRSELMSLMTGGMATIAGSVLVAYIGQLGEEYASHFLAASLLSAPAAILAAKMLVPETEEFSDSMDLDDNRTSANALEALANGTTDGLRLAVNVAGMLIVFTALIFGINMVLGYGGRIGGLNEVIAASTDGQFTQLSFEFIMGYALAPVAWLVGVCSDDMVLVGQLLGKKTVLNEFLAYLDLGAMKNGGKFAEQRSIELSTYILCGFSNFASIGIQIGGIGALAPTRKGLLSKLGFRALVGGTVACLLTAAIVGMML